MSYLKFTADRLFDGYDFKSKGEVLVTNEEGRIEAIVPASEAGDDIQHLNGIIAPGFVNCHCHLELSHMKGLIPEKTGLIDFVFKVVTQRHFADEEILAAIEKAEDEMLDNGIVAVGDICNNTLTLAQKTRGRLYYHNFIEASGFHPQVAAQRFERSLGFFCEYAKHYSIPAESISIVPHAPYSVSDELWEMILHFPGNHLMTIHNQETGAEDQLFLNGEGEFLSLYKKMAIDCSFFKPSGKSSLQTYLPKFLRNQSLILVHNVHTSEKDIRFSKNLDREIHWCLCPNANLYITGQTPPVEQLVANRCNIVLGTDSIASNHQLSILSEMAAIRQSFPSLGLSHLLQWATINGARALQMDKLLGSFEPGKHPGVILINDELSASRRLL